MSSHIKGNYMAVAVWREQRFRSGKPTKRKATLVGRRTRIVGYNKPEALPLDFESLIGISLGSGLRPSNHMQVATFPRLHLQLQGELPTLFISQL